MRKLAYLLVLALLVMALPAFAQDEEGDMMMPHTECQVDLTGVEIPIVHLGDISSPGYAPITLPVVAGLADSIAYFNEMGGICGATLVQQNFDTGGDPTRTTAGYEELTTSPIDMLILYSSADSELLRPTLAEDQVPAMISAGSVPGLYGENADEPGWIYATNPVYADQFGMFCDYIAANPEDFPDPVIGYIGWGGPYASFGLGAFTEGAIAHCEEAGVTLISEPQTFLPTADATAVSTQVETLIGEGATILYVNALASGPVRVAEALELVGFSGEIQIGSVNWGMDTSAALLSMASLRASDGLPVVDGMIGSMPFYWWSDTDQPGIQLIIEQAMANERQITSMNIGYILGWSITDIYVELYTRAANKLAAEGMTDPQEIMDAIDGAMMKDLIENTVYSPLGLYPFDYQGGLLRALPYNRIVQMTFDSADITGPPVLAPLTDFEQAPDTVGVTGE